MRDDDKILRVFFVPRMPLTKIEEAKFQDLETINLYRTSDNDLWIQALKGNLPTDPNAIKALASMASEIF